MHLNLVSTLSMTSQISSDFLLGLILEENKHLNLIDFINKDNKACLYCCVCVSMAVANKYQRIQEIFTETDLFLSEYFEIYANAMDNYRSLVKTNIRQILIDEARIFYPLTLETKMITNLVTDPAQRVVYEQIMDQIKTNHSYVLLLRDDIVFVIIHYENDNFIIIDPHIEFCGILSAGRIYRYVTYDAVWDLSVRCLYPPVTETESVTVPTIDPAMELVVAEHIAEAINTPIFEIEQMQHDASQEETQSQIS